MSLCRMYCIKCGESAGLMVRLDRGSLGQDISISIQVLNVANHVAEVVINHSALTCTTEPYRITNRYAVNGP